MSPVQLKPNFKISDANLKIILYFIIGLIVYLVLTGKLRKARAADQYSQAGTDPNTNYAIGIRQACNPSGIDLMINIDGTFKNDLMIIADQISDLSAVNVAYNRLYNEIMYERLEKELDAKKYLEWIRRAKTIPTTAPVPGSVADVDYVAVRDTVVYSDSNSSQIARRVKAGEPVGKRLGTYKITVNGVAKLYYLVTWTTFIFLTNQGLVLASDVAPE